MHFKVIEMEFLIEKINIKITLSRNWALAAMLFVFLVDEDAEMKNLVLSSSMTDSPQSPFQPTSLDGALYFVECFSKV